MTKQYVAQENHDRLTQLRTNLKILKKTSQSSNYLQYDKTKLVKINFESKSK
jgi:hypothetical protein